MANNNNLIPLNKRTKSEQRAIAKKGGIASGKARRKKANLKSAIEQLLTLEVPDEDIRQELETMGLEPTMEQALAYSLVIRVVRDGDPRAFEVILRAIDQNKTLADKQEQRVRIAKLKAETERIRQAVDCKSENTRAEEANAQVRAIADLITNQQTLSSERQNLSSFRASSNTEP